MKFDAHESTRFKPNEDNISATDTRNETKYGKYFSANLQTNGTRILSCSSYDYQTTIGASECQSHVCPYCNYKSAEEGKVQEQIAATEMLSVEMQPSEAMAMNSYDADVNYDQPADVY